MIYCETVFNLDLPSLLPLFGKRFEKILAQEKNVKLLEKAGKEFIACAKPTAVWRRIPIEFFNESSVTLKGGVEIGGGPVTHVIDAAEEVIIGLCTIGPEPERISREALKNGNSLFGMLMDFLGSWGADRVKEDFYNSTKKSLADSEGLRTSTMLSPGESEWDISEQGKIYTLVEEDASRSGVSLTGSNMLVPLKSLSFLFGIGRNPMGHEHAESCAFCTMREKCVYRKYRKY